VKPLAWPPALDGFPSDNGNSLWDTLVFACLAAISAALLQLVASGVQQKLVTSLDWPIEMNLTFRSLVVICNMIASRKIERGWALRPHLLETSVGSADVFAHLSNEETIE
jgi:hypothetical protein